MPPTPNPPHLLLFGATGSIGASIADAALTRGWQVTGVARTPGATLTLDPLSPTFTPESLRTPTPYTAVCWAQGANTTDSILEFDLARHREILDANLTYILITLNSLLTVNLLAPASKLVVISSIWQRLARQNKLSYCISKAALEGLVLSTAADLAPHGHLVNAILPGALDTPMTRRNLAPEQIDRLATATGHNRLPALADVANLACFLLGPENTGITAQFITADLGFSSTRLV